jgi:hypothetical protein
MKIGICTTLALCLSTGAVHAMYRASRALGDGAGATQGAKARAEAVKALQSNQNYAHPSRPRAQAPALAPLAHRGDASGLGAVPAPAAQPARGTVTLAPLAFPGPRPNLPALAPLPPSTVEHKGAEAGTSASTGLTLDLDDLDLAEALSHRSDPGTPHTRLGMPAGDNRPGNAFSFSSLDSSRPGHADAEPGAGKADAPSASSHRYRRRDAADSTQHSCVWKYANRTGGVVKLTLTFQRGDDQDVVLQVVEKPSAEVFLRASGATSFEIQNGETVQLMMHEGVPDRICTLEAADGDLLEALTLPVSSSSSEEDSSSN